MLLELLPVTAEQGNSEEVKMALVDFAEDLPGKEVAFGANGLVIGFV